MTSASTLFRRANHPVRALLALSAFFLFSTILPAQQHLSAPRSDGKSTPLLLYPAQGASQACAPLAILSHGAGGSESGYRYLAEAMAQSGFTTIVMGHQESGLHALTSDMRAEGFRPGIRSLVADRNAEQARLLDVGAALRYADKQCHAPFRVLLGHSMGAETVMLEAGARNIINVPSPPAGRDRFDAYIALSPEGPGVVFPDNAWNAIRKPVLILTGTRDQSLQGGPQARQVPFNSLPGRPDHCQWMGVIDSATHMNFAGTGLGASSVETEVDQIAGSFLTGVRARSCTLPPTARRVILRAK